MPLIPILLLSLLVYLPLCVGTVYMWTALWKDLDRDPGPREQILIGIACPIVFPLGCVILFIIGAYFVVRILLHGLVHNEW